MEVADTDLTAVSWLIAGEIEEEEIEEGEKVVVVDRSIGMDEKREERVEEELAAARADDDEETTIVRREEEEEGGGSGLK